MAVFEYKYIENISMIQKSLQESKESKEKTVSKSAHKVEHRKYKGLPISIEQRKGGVRHWYDPLQNKHGQTKFKYPYGYIRGTEGEDRDHVDVFLGPNEDSDHVFIVEQVNPDTGLYDEDKVMLGFDSLVAAEKAYLAHYDNPKFLSDIHFMNFAEFVEKLTENGQGRKLVQKSNYKKFIPHKPPTIIERIKEISKSLNKKWPDGELRQNCKLCNKPSELDFYINKQNIWDKITGKYKNNVLCLNCFDMMAYKKKIDYKKYLDRKLSYTGLKANLELIHKSLLHYKPNLTKIP